MTEDYIMSTQIQILLVDDEVRFLQTLAERLTIRDFDVVTATNGFEALEKARGYNLDLAIVDLKMPGMDGEELLAKLKQEHPLMEVVILTGHGSAVSKQRCEEVGSYSYLNKPCEMHELVDILREAFQRRMMRRLDMEREQLELLVRQSAGEHSLTAILRMKEIEEKLLRKKSGKG
jgi:DNA-binding NtrC family response regulator